MFSPDLILLLIYSFCRYLPFFYEINQEFVFHFFWLAFIWREILVLSVFGDSRCVLLYYSSLVYNMNLILTLITRRHWFYRVKLCLLSHISEVWTAISRINEPIPGMFVLIWMHFTLWFQNVVMKFHNVDIFCKLC